VSLRFATHFTFGTQLPRPTGYEVISSGATNIDQPLINIQNIRHRQEMAIFQDKWIVERLFGEFLLKMIDTTEFGQNIGANGISLFFEVDDPDLVMFVDKNGPRFGRNSMDKTPLITLKMSCDSMHRFWLNRLNIPEALAQQTIRAKGPVGKTLQLLPLLKLGQDIYPDYCLKYNLPVE
jgi:hypothetical protein